MTLYDELDLTLELLGHHDHSYLVEESVEPRPPDVIRFRVPRPR